jgi:2'-5' RNA ligase
MDDHWKFEPGTDLKRARLTWFIRVGDYEPVAQLARLGQQRLAGLGGLDLVPREWLHITTLIAGYADQIMPDQVDEMIAEATRRAADLRPVEVTLGRVLYHPRAVMLEAGPAAALEPVLDMVGYATRAATGQYGELHTAPWVPHITLAYSNAAQPAGPVIAALGRQLPGRKAAITSVSLVSQTPQQKWTWNLISDVPFGCADHAVP